MHWLASATGSAAGVVTCLRRPGAFVRRFRVPARGAGARVDSRGVAADTVAVCQRLVVVQGVLVASGLACISDGMLDDFEYATRLHQEINGRLTRRSAFQHGASSWSSPIRGLASRKPVSWDIDDLPPVCVAPTVAVALEGGTPSLLRRTRARVLTPDGALRLWKRLKLNCKVIQQATTCYGKGELPTPDKVFLVASRRYYDNRQLQSSDINAPFLRPLTARFGVEFKHLSVLCTWNGWTTMEHVEEQCGAGFGTHEFGAPKTWFFWKPGAYPAGRRPDMVMTTKTGDTFVIPR